MATLDSIGLGLAVGLLVYLVVALLASEKSS